MRVQQREGERPETSGDAFVPATPVVSIDVCRCGSAHALGAPHEQPHEEPSWPLASAWAWLTAPAAAPPDDLLDDDLLDDAEHDDVLLEDEDEPDPADLPWWDARSRPERRRAMLPLVLLGELQAGVLLRALWEVLQSSPPGPGA